ncbi:MAG: glycosyltransferase [Gammaproteobacteria bacterium]|nr:glycosyltransferase [Gammaproteobacteria bacterium]
MTPHIYLFSYNRARFLENCLASIRDCAPQCGVTIVDDSSDDRATVDLLRRCQGTHEILKPEGAVKIDVPYGGLYNNMNMALCHARDCGRERVVFIQDDIQFVRRLTETDVEYIEAFFSRYPRSFKLQTTFLKKGLKPYDERRMTLDAESRVYFRRREGPGLIDFSDVGVFHVPRFFESFRGNTRGRVEKR